MSYESIFKVNSSALVRVLSVLALLLAVTTPSLSQTFGTTANFANSNGASPYYGALVQGTDGYLYGSAEGGGSYSYGLVFDTATGGGGLGAVLTFTETNGANPYGGLTLGTDGYFYGTTTYGGSTNVGTVFSTSAGVIHNFSASSGSSPNGTLVQGTDGNFYGTTTYGGTLGGYGTVFKVSPTGTFTLLHTFSSSDGAFPYAGLVQGSDGNFYGTTEEDGTSLYGTVFKITPSGTLTTLHNFGGGSDGANPYAALVQGSDGNFYGTTKAGGTFGEGTIFKITSAGTLTTLYTFSTTYGAYPYAALIQGTDGNFYGTTISGGANSCNCGTVFKVTSAGVLTTLHSFSNTDGETPYGGLMQYTNGTFYGTTTSGGSYGYGTVFSLSTGLSAFVKTVPTSGPVATSVTILGTNLTGATKVTFNGTSATFTVASPYKITTKVPTGATTGTVKVTTPSGTLSSNVVFTVH